MAEPAPDLELAAGALRLRPYRSADAAPLFAAVRESIDSVGRWLPWCHAGYTLADAEGWIRLCAAEWRSGEHFAFALFDDAAGELVGGIGLNQRNRMHNFMSLGYWIRQSRQGRGVARRAARCVVDFGFDVVGLTRIEIVAQPGNGASRRVAESLGAVFEAIARNRIVTPAGPADAAVYALVPPLPPGGARA